MMQLVERSRLMPLAIPGTPVPPVPTTRPERPVRIFSAGSEFGGQHKFTVDDLRKVVDNFNRYQSGYRSPQVTQPKAVHIPDIDLGHENIPIVREALLNRTDLPSCGRPTRIWLQGADLFAELDGVPLPIAQMANAGQFSEVSAEIYPNYRGPDGSQYGPLLKRVSLLGSTPPRQKGLGRLPVFVYSEPGPRRQQVHVSFSESPFMTREEAIAILTAAGIDPALFEGVPDPFLIAVATAIKGPPGPAPTLPAPVDATNLPAMFAEMNRQNHLALLAAVSPILQTVRGMQATFSGIQSKTERQEVETFAETNRKKLFPFEAKPDSPHYILARLMKLPADQRAAEMSAIANRPDVEKFGETMADPAPGGGTGSQRQTGSTGPMSADRKKALMDMSPLTRAAAKKLALRN